MADDELGFEEEAVGGDGRKVKKTDNKQKSGEPVESVAAAELRSMIERVERLQEEKDAISSDIKDVLGEAKGRGYDTKAIRTILRLRKKDTNERLEEESILQTYMAALGMIMLDQIGND